MKASLLIFLIMGLTACERATFETHKPHVGPAGQDGVSGVDGNDGVDGSNGTDGQDSIMELIDPCGPSAGPDEILFVLSSGEIVAYYQDIGFVALEPGNYVTTDDQACLFTISADGEYSE